MSLAAKVTTTTTIVIIIKKAQRREKTSAKFANENKNKRNLGKREIVSHFARFQNKAPTTFKTHT